MNLVTLGFFKYYNFFLESLHSLLNGFGISFQFHTVQFILPLGISFYIFQSLGYVIDCYRGHLTPSRNPLHFLLFVSFFPHLVAGPILRAPHLLPQFTTERRLRWEKVYTGISLALWGFFKKMVIADNLVLVVDRVFNMKEPSGLDVAIGTYAFAFQIYCDFSGYTDIARGVARILGFDLGLNFNFPYLAIHPSDFWKRWHISLSTWLRDYLYIPLGGNRGGPTRTIKNLMITMLLGGLWHGAAWNFIIWGLYHGLLLCGFNLLEKKKTKATSMIPPPHVLNLKTFDFFFWLKVLAFFQATCLGWLIFRVKDISQLTSMLKSLIHFSPTTQLSHAELLIVPALILPFWIFEAIYSRKPLAPEPWLKWSVPLKVPFFLFLFYSIVLFGTPHRVEFIYFQF